MASIDERVVAMSFENSKFEQGVAQTMNTLGKLENSLQNVGKNSGLQGLEQQASRINLSGLTNAVEGVGRGFTLLGGIASVALGGLVTKAISAGANITKALTLGPITEGFHNYETQINAVQTILANTGLTGQQGIDKVNASLSVLNDYANKTIFNFGEMAKNIGTFTAAGVGLEQATASIKGIANLAALSGSTSQQASTAMYQLSQAIAAGTVHLQDWNSVVNAGMGGEVFQKALFNTAKAMGTLTNVPVGQTFEEWKKAGNSFRQSLSTTAKQGKKDVDVVKDAQKEAAKTIADVNKSAADSIEASAGRVKDAQKGQAEAAQQGARDVADAVKAQSDTVRQAAEDVKSALDGVREARKRLAEAMKPASEDELQAATDKLTTSQLDQADLATAVTDAQTEQKRAAEDLAAAQAKLNAVLHDPKATPDQKQSAQRAVEDATKRVTDAADAQTRALLQQRAATRDVDQAEKDLTTTREKGTKKDKAVKDARDALTVATEKYKDAQKKQAEDVAKAAQHVRDVQIKAAESTAKAGENLAKAEKDQADTIQTAQEKIADAHQAAADKIKAARASLDTAMPKSWLTSDVLTTTLETFTGDLSDAQLKAKGFTDAQIKSIQSVAKVAVQSATQIKTFSQLTQALREEVGSAWANVFKTLFGNISQARTLFTDFHNFAQAALTGPVIALNKLLQGWAKLGGRAVFIDALKQGFKDLMALIKPVHDAFRDIFPAQTAQGLFELTKKFKELMDNLETGPKKAAELRRTFDGFFAVLHIGVTIVKDVIKFIGDLFGLAANNSDGFFSITGSIGDFFVALDKALTEGDSFYGFLKALEPVLRTPIELIKTLGKVLGQLFSGNDPKKAQGVADSMSKVNDSLKPLHDVLKFVADAWDRLMAIFDKVAVAIQPALDKIGSVVANFGTTVANSFRNADFGNIFDALQTGLVAGIFLTLKKGLSKGLHLNFDTGALSNLSDALKAVTGNLKAMQRNIEAGTLLKIATSITALAIGIKILSTIPADKLKESMGAVAIGLSELVAAMVILSRATGSGAFLTMPFIAGSMVLLATSITILAGAMKIMATMNWEELAKGLTGLGGALVAIGIGTKAIGPNIIYIGPGLLAIGIALNVIAVAMKIFATLKWDEIGRGLAGIAGSLTAIGFGIQLMGPSLILVGPGLVAVSIALTLLSGAVKSFSTMNLEEMSRGVIGIAAALVAIGLAIQTIPPTVALQAAGLVILSVALAGIAASIAILGNMNITTIVKGIAAIGASLIVLALGLDAMSGTLLGAAALLAAASALAILVPTLVVLGHIKWSVLLKGLAALVVVLGTLAITGALASEGLIALGIGLAPIAAVFLAMSAAVYLLAKAIAVMGDSSPKAVASVLIALSALALALPRIVISFLKGMVEIGVAISKLMPRMVQSLGLIMDEIIAFVIRSAPKLAVAIGVLVDSAIAVIVENSPKLINAGFILLNNLLIGIDQNLPTILPHVASIVTTFLSGLAAALPDMINAGVKALVAFLSGITQHLPQVVTTVITLVATFVATVAANVHKLIEAAGKLMIAFVSAIASFQARLLIAGVNTILHFLQGIANALPKIFNAAVGVAAKFLAGLAHGLVRLVNVGFEALINFLNGLANAIRTHDKDLRAAGWNIADAIIDGIVGGFAELGQKAIDAVGNIIGHLPKAARKILGIHSPSVVFDTIGRQTMEGLTYGITSGGADAVGAVADTTNKMVDTASNGLSKVPTFLSKVTDMNPTITPVLDLSRVEEDAPKIGSLIQDGSNVIKLSDKTVATESTNAAAGLSFAMASSDPWGKSATDVNDWIAKHPIVFNQHNTSPKALTPAEVYRLTHNQLASAKGRLFGKVDNIR